MSLVSGMGSENKISGQEMLFVFLLLGEFQGFQELHARNQGQIPVYIF